MRVQVRYRENAYCMLICGGPILPQTFYSELGIFSTLG